MGLFGGGSKTTTSKMTRPDYVQGLIGSLSGQAANMDQGEWQDRGFAGLTPEQQEAYKQLSSNPELTQLANQLISGGQQGLGQIDSAYSQLQNLQQNGAINPQQVQQLASQLYDTNAVDASIKAQQDATKQQLAESQLPQIAEQQNMSGWGSGQRVMSDMAQRGALQTMQGQAADTANQAYNNAINQATSILSGNRQVQGAALSGLAQTGTQSANAGVAGNAASQQAMQNSLLAGNLQQQQAQAQSDNDYFNKQGKANYAYQQINNQLGAASTLNGAEGQTTKQTASGGGSGLLGGVLSTAGAVVGGIYGGPAGAAIGAQLGGMAGTALS